VTGLVEVLEVERVIPHLVARRPVEGGRADLELDHQDDPRQQHHRVHPAPHPRDGELEEEMAGEPLKRAAQDRDLRAPGFLLRELDVELAAAGQLAYD